MNVTLYLSQTFEEQSFCHFAFKIVLTFDIATDSGKMSTVIESSFILSINRTCVD